MSFLFITSIFCCGCRTEVRNEALKASPADSVSPAFPAPFENYQILPDTTSPDGKLAIIFPRRDVVFPMLDDGSARLSLVSLSPFQRVCDIPLGRSGLIFGHGSYAVTWMADSSALLMIQGLKWGPDRVYLCELRGQAKPGLTDLGKLACDEVRPAILAAGLPRLNDRVDFIITDADDDVRLSGEQTLSWDFAKSGDVAIDCTFTNNPKFDTLGDWMLRWRAVWSRIEGKFINVQSELRPH